MNQQTQPANPFDLTKLMGEFDPTKMMELFTKTLGEYKIPGMDINALVETQRKNVEALTNANKVVVEGMQSVLSRQTEILRQTMQEATNAIKEISSAGSPADAAAKQAELLRQAFDKALANMRELAEITTKANSDAFNTINKRISDSIHEIKEMAQHLRKA